MATDFSWGCFHPKAQVLIKNIKPIFCACMMERGTYIFISAIIIQFILFCVGADLN